MSRWTAEPGAVDLHELMDARSLAASFEQLQYGHSGFINATKLRLEGVADMVERRLHRELARSLHNLEQFLGAT